jgi:hypothetical protein
MINLTDEMAAHINKAQEEGNPCLVATASASGKPDITYKGSVMVFDNQSLAYWERSRGTTLRNLEENPQIMVLYRNPAERIRWRFSGVATIYREGDLRQQVMNRTVQRELDADPERKGVAVIIRVDEVIDGNQVVQRREE